MRIAIFSETYLPDANGVATHVKTLKDGLEALGNEVLVVMADANSRKHYINKDVMHCPAITAKKLYNYSISSPVSINRMLMLKKWNPDIIHIQNEFGIGLSGILIAKLLKKPLVYTIHTMYDDYIYYVAQKPFLPIMTDVSHKYFKLVATNASAVTGASKKIQDYLKVCGVRKPINIIPNAVELDIFDDDKIDQQKVSDVKKQYNLTDDLTVACFCGRLGKEKSIDVMLQFWAEKFTVKDNLRLFIFGDGPAHDELKSLSSKLNLDEMVFFTGKVTHADLPPYYAACNLYLTASLSENYSISMLEAMASGLPIVHLFDEKNENQTIEGINGFVYHNAEEMSTIITRIRDLSVDKKKEMSDNVKLSVKQSGSDNLARYIMDIYLSLDKSKEKNGFSNKSS